MLPPTHRMAEFKGAEFTDALWVATVIELPLIQPLQFCPQKSNIHHQILRWFRSPRRLPRVTSNLRQEGLSLQHNQQNPEQEIHQAATTPCCVASCSTCFSMACRLGFFPRVAANFTRSWLLLAIGPFAMMASRMN